MNRQNRKRQHTRNHIAATAFALFEAHSYEAVTMEQIASAADVARGTVYNHFPIKEAVLAHSMHEQLGRDLKPLLANIAQQLTFNDRVTLLLASSAAWWEAHRRYLAPYVRYRFQCIGTTPQDRQNTAPTDLVATYQQLIATAQHDGELRADVNPLRLAHYLHFLYLCALMRWLEDPQLSLTNELSRVLEFFQQGAQARR